MGVLPLFTAALSDIDNKEMYNKTSTKDNVANYSFPTSTNANKDSCYSGSYLKTTHASHFCSIWNTFIIMIVKYLFYHLCSFQIQYSWKPKEISGNWFKRHLSRIWRAPGKSARLHVLLIWLFLCICFVLLHQQQSKKRKKEKRNVIYRTKECHVLWLYLCL